MFLWFKGCWKLWKYGLCHWTSCVTLTHNSMFLEDIDVLEEGLLLKPRSISSFVRREPKHVLQVKHTMYVAQDANLHSSAYWNIPHHPGSQTRLPQPGPLPLSSSTFFNCISQSSPTQVYLPQQRANEVFSTVTTTLDKIIVQLLLTSSELQKWTLKHV